MRILVQCLTSTDNQTLIILVVTISELVKFQSPYQRELDDLECHVNNHCSLEPDSHAVQGSMHCPPPDPLAPDDTFFFVLPIADVSSHSRPLTG